MLAQNVSAQRNSETAQSGFSPAGDSEGHQAVAQQAAEKNIVVLNGELELGAEIERREETKRFSPRLSIAVIAGLSALLWLGIVAVFF